MKKLISILLILCFITNIAFALRVPSAQAGELVLKKKDPEKAKKLAIFPGFIVHGAGQIYAGEITDGLLNLTFEIGSIYIFINCVNGLINLPDEKTDPLGNVFGTLLFLPGAIGSFCGIFGGILMDYFYSSEIVERWNNAVDTNDFSRIKLAKMKKAKISLGIGLGYCTLAYLFDPSDLERLVSPLIITTLITSSYLLEAKRLPKGIEKKTEINLFPVVAKNYYGFALVKGF